MWRVGDGRTIEFSTRNWLSHKPVFLGEPRPNLYVRDLIDLATMQMQRDRNKIFDLFAHRTRMELLAIPLSRTSLRDTLIWKENDTNTFTVKTTYHVALRMKEQSRTEHSGARSNRHLWKKNLDSKYST